jgi:hypothetical protein
MRRLSSATTGHESGEGGGPDDEDVTYYTNSQVIDMTYIGVLWRLSYQKLQIL